MNKLFVPGCCGVAVVLAALLEIFLSPIFGVKFSIPWLIGVPIFALAAAWISIRFRKAFGVWVALVLVVAVIVSWKFAPIMSNHLALALVICFLSYTLPWLLWRLSGSKEKYEPRLKFKPGY